MAVGSVVPLGSELLGAEQQELLLGAQQQELLEQRQKCELSLVAPVTLALAPSPVDPRCQDQVLRASGGLGLLPLAVVLRQRARAAVVMIVRHPHPHFCRCLRSHKI